METKKQAVSGFKVGSFSVKKVKDEEKVRLVLEASVDDIGAGEYNVGDVLKALLNCQIDESDIGLAMFM